MNPDLYSELFEDAQATISDLNEQISILLNDNASLRKEIEELNVALDNCRYGDSY